MTRASRPPVGVRDSKQTFHHALWFHVFREYRDLFPGDMDEVPFVFARAWQGPQQSSCSHVYLAFDFALVWHACMMMQQPGVSYSFSFAELVVQHPAQLAALYYKLLKARFGFVWPRSQLKIYSVRHPPYSHSPACDLPMQTLPKSADCEKACMLGGGWFSRGVDESFE